MASFEFHGELVRFPGHEDVTLGRSLGDLQTGGGTRDFAEGGVGRARNAD
jgi:hypothetical protein